MKPLCKRRFSKLVVQLAPGGIAECSPSLFDIFEPLGRRIVGARPFGEAGLDAPVALFDAARTGVRRDL
jgi:hypothetical protein